MEIASRGHSFTHDPHATQSNGLNFATLFDIIRTTILLIVPSYTIFTKARLITLFIPFNYHYFFISTMTRSQKTTVLTNNFFFPLMVSIDFKNK